MKKKLLILCFIISGFCSLAQTTFIASGDTWKYVDDGSNQGTAWSGTGFNDGAWSSGISQLGYGDGDEATIVNYGPSSSNRYATTYFRKTVNIANPASFAQFTLRIKRDDGIIVYVNGIEAYRDNMSAGSPAYNSYSAATCGDDGSVWISNPIPTSLFVSGNNTIAAEIHNASGTSSDISFDLELTGDTTVTNISRGPYLQAAGQTSITIRWRTYLAQDSKVKYGTALGVYSDSVTLSSATNEHIVPISGLTPDTKYFYSIGSSTSELESGPDNYFYTLPPTGTQRKYTIWATGDCGTGYSTQDQVRDQYMNYIGTNKTDAWILLGDNAYTTCSDPEFQANFFDQYTQQLKNMNLYPTPGNHDYYTGATDVQEDPTIPYYQNFTTPFLGQCGGVASGNAAYYSFDLGNIHFISLDSYGEETGNNKKFYDTTCAQVAWMKNDLNANAQKWTIVYFHHPPYTKGSHNSDTETDLIAIRQNFIRILERYKVDIILCGHSHNYERTKLIKGHYGNEASFASGTHNKSTSSGKYDGTANSCPYIKNGTTGEGTVYVVAGTAGKFGGTSTGWPHDAMYYSSDANGGSFVIEVEENRLDAKWLCDDGVIRDQFTIMKDVNTVNSYTVTSGQTLNLNSSWIGNYVWNNGGATMQDIVVNPTASTTYYVNDGINCLADSFHVTVSGTIGLENLVSEKEVRIFPNPSNGVFTISINPKEEASLQLVNQLGSVIETFTLNAENMNKKLSVETSGVYYIVGKVNGAKVQQKIIVIRN